MYSLKDRWLKGVSAFWLYLFFSLLVLSLKWWIYSSRLFIWKNSMQLFLVRQVGWNRRVARKRYWRWENPDPAVAWQTSYKHDSVKIGVKVAEIDQISEITLSFHFLSRIDVLRGPILTWTSKDVLPVLFQLFHVAYVFIKMANSPRPEVWVLERSRDNGETFKPWQYFAETER